MKNGSKIIESIESFKKATDIEPGKAFEELKLKADIQPVASFELAKTIESTKKHLETAKKNLEPCLKASEELVKDTAVEESKDRFKTPKTKDLKAMGLSEGIKKPTTRVINESTLDDRVFLGSIKLGDTEYFVTGDKTHTKNYHYEEIKIEGRDKSSFSGYSVVGFGRYRWMNRPWQKYEFANALESAFIDWQPKHKEEIRKIVEENSSAKGALVQVAKTLCGVVEESRKEDKSTKELSKEQITNIYKELDFSDKENIERAYFRKDGDKEQLVIEYTDEKGIKGKYEPTLEKEQLDVILKESVETKLKESFDSDVEDYKEEVNEALDNFKDSYEDLKDKLFFGEYDANEFITGKETLELMDMSFAPVSLDELLISDWVDSVKEALDKWEPGEVVEGLNTKKVVKHIKEQKAEKPLKESVESEIFYDHFGTAKVEFQDIVEEILKRLELEDLKKKVLADEDSSE